MCSLLSYCKQVYVKVNGKNNVLTTKVEVEEVSVRKEQ